MKKYSIGLILSLSVVLLFEAESNAQCAMCRRIAETDKQAKTADRGRSLNNGILYLLSVPYLIGAAGAIAWYKNRKKLSS